MLNWAWRQWLSEPGRAVLAMAVYAGVLALSMLFDGIRVGIVADLRAFPASLPADLVAIEKGNIYFAIGSSKLPQRARAQAEGVPEVLEAQPIVLAPFVLAHGGQRTPAMLLAYEQRGGPRTLVAGRVPSPAPDVVLDENLAGLHGLEVGDTVRIFDSDLAVVGLSTGTTSPFTPYAFVTYDRLIDLAIDADLPFGTSDMSLVSALLIKIRAGADMASARRRLAAAVPDADVFTPAELGAADARFGERLLGPVLILISSLAWLITLLTMGMLRYAEVQSHLHQFGIQKALGARPAWLAAALALGGVLIAVSALPLALVLVKVLASVTSGWNPLYGPRVWEPMVVARAVVVSLVAVIAGGLLPWRRLVRLEPVIVFKR